MYTWQDIGLEIYRRLALRNPIVPGTIAARGADINGTPQVSVTVAGERVPAIFAPPRPVVTGGPVWLTRLRPGGAGVVLWTNYQGGGGLGTGGIGVGPLGQ